MSESTAVRPQDRRWIRGATRAAILRALSVEGPLSFAEVKEILHLTDGNVSQHAKAMERDGLITVSKRFEENKPLTTYRLTEKGWAAL
jgi:DNA-binding MarR family transcriptional regulator